MSRSVLLPPLLLLAAVAVPSPAPAAFREQARAEAAYRQALASWSQGNEEVAFAQLQRLDAGALAGTRQAARLERAKVAVGRALARRQPAALLAAVAFEQRAYEAYARRQPPLAAEARRAVAALVEAHAATDRAPAAVALDAALLASLAGELAARSQQVAAADFYGKALAHSPEQPAALLGLAALHEQHGQYAAAVDLLSTLVAAHPRGREGRLRLAVNQLRLGRGSAAERELRALAADGLDWVQSLAAQELARLLVARGELSEAVRLLAEVAALLPCDPSLPVQGALVAERAGIPVPLDLSAQSACGEAAESARARYTHAPGSELVPLREGLAAEEPKWRRALAAALGVAHAARGSDRGGGP